jgi:hypothetical protein
MQRRQLFIFGSTLLLAGYAATVGRAAELQQQGRQIFASVPLVFEENRGQTDPQFEYLSHADGYTLLLGKSEAVLGSGLHMRWVGANRDPKATGVDRLAATSNYFRGNDRSHWMTGIANYRQVKYRQLYPGIDVLYYGNQRQLEYDIHIAPGIDPRHAELAFDDAAALRVDSVSGDLLVASLGGTTRLHKPVAYQQVGDTERRDIEVSYSIRRDHHVRFQVGRYDHHRDLVIDPTVVYGTYFAGTSGASANSFMFFLGIGTDANGNIYVAGYQQNPALPTTPGSYQPNCISDPSKTPNCFDYFIAKFDPSQSGANSLVYSTFIGTAGGVNPAESDFFYNREFAVDSAGNAYLAGVTDDAAYPTTASAYEPHCYQIPGNTTPALCYRDISFLTKLNPSGSALLYSTYFGDPDYPSTYVMAVDDSGRAFVAGTGAGNGVLPVTNGAPCPTSSASGICPGNYVGAFDTTQSGHASLIYLEYITLTPTGLATDGLGNAYVYGEAEQLLSATFTVPNGYQTVSDGGGSNTLLQKFNLSGTISYGTFFQATTPGAADMHAAGVAADASGRAFITGYSNSTTGNQNLPNLNGLPVPAVLNCCSYAYLGVIDTTQSGAASLLYGTKILPSTLPAFEINGYASSVATDGAGKVLIAAQNVGGVQPSGSPSPLYPIVNPLPNAAPGQQTAALTLIDTTQSGAAALLFSSPIDGSGNQGMQVWIDAADNLYLAGSTVYVTTYSPSLPTTSNGYEPQVASGDLAPYLLKITLTGTSAAPTVTLTAAPTTLTLGQSSTLTWSSSNATACTASGGWSGSESLSGTQSVTPAAAGTATYTLSCSGTGGIANASAAVTANAVGVPAPTVTLTASPTTITEGQSTMLSWSSTNATSCSASGAWTGTQTVSGTMTETPTASGTATYTLTCTDSGGSAMASANVTVNAVAPPTVSIAVNPTSITVGQSATLTWSSTNASSCTASGAWTGTQPSSGTLQVTPAAASNNAYTLVCVGASAETTATATAMLEVQAAPLIVVTALSGKAGGGGLGLNTVLGLLLLVALRMRRLLRPQGLAAVALLVISVQASAQESSSAYVGVRAGVGDYMESSQRLDAAIESAGESTTTTSVTQHRAAGVVYAGMPFYRMLSVEIGFADLGTYPVGISTQTTNIPQLAGTITRKLPPAGRGLTLNLAAPLDVSSWLAFEPRLGLLAYQSKQEVFTPAGTVADDRKGAGLDAGLALMLFPHSRFSVGAGADCFAAGGRCNVMLYSAVLEYHFGGR